MPRKTSIPLPAVKRALAQLGENIRLARLRRRFSAAMVAERAGMSRPTLRAIENGRPTATVGALANVLHCLGFEAQLANLAADDLLGRKLQDANLAVKKRAPKRKTSPERDKRK